MDGCTAGAWRVGARIDPRDLGPRKQVAGGPATFALDGGGYVVAFRYGVLVFFGAAEGEQRACMRQVVASVSEPAAEPEQEHLEIVIDPEAPERMVGDGVLSLRALDTGRIQAVAQVLAKSVVLAHYEEAVAAGSAGVESRAAELQRGPGRARTRELLREIGGALAIQAQTVGRVEVSEKPEVVWDDAELDRIYELLAAEYEIRDRDVALERKLRLVSDTASTLLELIHTRKGLRVEWYIVILIVLEIGLIVYDLWRH